MSAIERIANAVGAAAGLLMRAVDWLTSKRRTWMEERRKP